MAKKEHYQEVFDTTRELYTELIRNAGLTSHVNITVLADNKAKKIVDVKTANKILNFRTGDDVIILLNEKIFDKLPEDQRRIVVEESLASIHYDGDNDRIVITKPDVITYSGILSKHTYATWNALRESIKSLYQAEKEEEDKRAAATEKAKKARKFTNA